MYTFFIMYRISHRVQIIRLNLKSPNNHNLTIYIDNCKIAHYNIKALLIHEKHYENRYAVWNSIFR